MANLTIIVPKETDEDLDVYKQVDDVIKQMTLEVALFPNPPVPLELLKSQNEEFFQSIPSEENSSIVLESAKLEKKRIVIAGNKNNALYVLMIAGNDREKAARSGYRLNKAGVSKQKPTKPVVTKVVPGDEPGTIRISLKDNAGCNFFLVELHKADGSYTIVDGFDWVKGSLVRNLPSGKSFIRIFGRKGKDTSPYTDDFEVRAF